MKKKEKTYSVALASTFIILFLILVLPTVSASGGAGDPYDEKDLSDELSTEGKSIVTAAPNFTETRITNDLPMKYYLVIYGNMIAWMGWNGSYDDIYMYDLSTKKETQITTNGSAYLESSGPAIYGNKIVWVDCRGENVNNIYMYDVSTSTETKITNDRSSPLNPAIYGDRIVWQDRDIYMYNLSTKKETQITNDGLNNSNPAIYEDRIVYSKGGDIYMYNLSTSTETQITNDGSNQIDPDIYGNTIVWTDTPNENYDIYRYDISTSKETRMTNDGSRQWRPAIYGNRIVWDDNRSGNRDIYVYDLSTGQVSHTTNTSSQVWPDIYGDKIVWVDYRNGYSDIYMGTIITAPPAAAFSASPTSGTAPLNVSFTDNSTGTPTSWEWTFGDGTNSTEQNPTHKYSEAGNYTVGLTAANELGSNTTTKVDYIKVKATKPVANFSAKPTSGNAPLNVAFIDKSRGSPTSWNWSFGDGTYSTVQNPKHTYFKLGNYTVGLTATNAAGSNTTKKVNYIKVNATKPVANFTSNVTSGNAPLDVAFTDKSLGLPTAWNWTFGDGVNSTQQNPTHKYSNAGNYTVTLTANNSAGSNKITKSSYIKVVSKPVANFTSNVTSGYVPLNVSFKDKSTGTPTSWKWTFGDGINSTKQNPTHTYSNAGNYTVTLTAINSAGSNKTTKPSYIKVNNP